MSGEITRALQNGDNDQVLLNAQSQFQNLWASIASRVIPDGKRRSEDVDDIIQETLLQLYKRLQSPAPFTSSNDILRWTADVAKKKALKSRDKSKRVDGPSSLASLGDDQQLLDNHAALEIAATQRRELNHPSQESAPNELTDEEIQLNATIAQLEANVATAINCMPERNRAIIEAYLNGSGNRAIAQQLTAESKSKITEYYVRNLTYLFKESLPLKEQVVLIRQRLVELEQSIPQIAIRLTIPPQVARLLVDFRSQA